MEIVTQPREKGLEVRVRGRLDNYWAEHLQRNLEEVVRGGAHVVWLNLAEVFYLSSAGVGLLVKFHKQLKAIGGTLQVTNPSEHVKMVIDLCHLSSVLFSENSVEAAPVAHEIETRRFTASGAAFELTEYSTAKALTCELLGDPELLRGCRFRPEDCRRLKFPDTSFGLGLGAFGNGFDDVKERCGEFLAVGGAAAYLPTDGTNVADFMVSRGDLVPEVNVLYGLRCEGGYRNFLRFESESSGNPISLAELARVGLETTGAPTIGIVIAAESAGLLAAALRRSPTNAEGNGAAPFQYPDVRKWLSFSTERLHTRSLALVAGVAADAECKALSALLRPLGKQGPPWGHFHAAAFSYRPLQKGPINLKTTVASLFETETLQGVLHLLSDFREGAGLQQSEFVRGACWVGGISRIQ